MKSREREFKFTLKDFNYLRNITNKKTGIMVSDDKFDMFYARLSKHVRRLGLSDFHDYCQVISRGESQEMITLINSVTTNLTSFFREKHHFDYMKSDFIPGHVKNKQDRKLLRIWSAGCSTGEEPYSIAMQALESLPLGWQVKITATDVDTDVLAKARTGVYPASKLDGVSDSRLKRWFYKGSEWCVFGRVDDHRVWGSGVSRSQWHSPSCVWKTRWPTGYRLHDCIGDGGASSPRL